MPLVFAAVMPHGGALLPGVEDSGVNASPLLTAAMERIGARARSEDLDVVVLADPHGMRLEDAHSITMSASVHGRLGPHEIKALVDLDLAERVLALSSFGHPLAGLTTQLERDALPIEWGSIVPLWFLGNNGDLPPLVIICPTRCGKLSDLGQFGEALADLFESDGRRIGFIASADNAHAHLEGGPYGFHPSARLFDDHIVRVTRDGLFDRWLDLDEGLIEAALPDSPWQLAILAGIFRRVPFRVTEVTYDCPSYYGMMTAAFERVQPV